MKALMNLTLGQIIGGTTGVLLALSALIEITPIKWNPLSSLLGWLGKRMNRDLSNRVDALSDKVSTLEDDLNKMESISDERDAIACRVRILHFGDQMRRGFKHSNDSFSQVLSDMDAYEDYCTSHPDFRNNKTVVTEQQIREEYARCLSENDFL